MNALKNILALSLFIALTWCGSTSLFASEGAYYIYGKCETVEGDTIKGFISFDNDKLWVANFEASKLKNPYAYLFKDNSGVLFSGGTASTPPHHIFTCRYNNISSLRPISNNRIEVTIKGRKPIDVSYRFEKRPLLHMSNGVTRELKWGNIVSIKFMSSPLGVKPPKEYGGLFVGHIESSQGVYFGIIDKKSNFFDDINGGQNATLNVTSSHKNNSISINGEATNIRQNSSIRIYMPSIGCVDVNWEQIKTIKRGGVSQITQASYENSIPATRIEGSVTIHGGKSCSGIMAFDLDEALNIEYLDGYNNGIRYMLLFSGIAEIKPRNYKYSSVTLKNGGVISIGDSRDVNYKNDGILMLTTGEYVAWRDIKSIKFNY